MVTRAILSGLVGSYKVAGALAGFWKSIIEGAAQTCSYSEVIRGNIKTRYDFI